MFLHTYYIYVLHSRTYVYDACYTYTCPTIRPLQKQFWKKKSGTHIINRRLYVIQFHLLEKIKYISIHNVGLLVDECQIFSKQTSTYTNVCHRRLWEVPCTIHSCSHSQVSRKLRERTKEHNFRFSKFYYIQISENMPPPAPLALLVWWHS